MEEHNKKTLIEALSSLPDHEPEEALWERIQDQLESSGTPARPKALSSLPTYEPPEHLWQGIVRQLDERPAGRILALRFGWKQALAVAASFALVLFAVFQLNQDPAEQQGFAISYSTETLDPLLADHDWNEDEEAFAEFLAICEAKKYICEQPAFQQLRSELDELTEAKISLQQAVGEYGADAGLVLQIKEIELERTDLVKKMMVMLI